MLQTKFKNLEKIVIKNPTYIYDPEVSCKIVKYSMKMEIKNLTTTTVLMRIRIQLKIFMRIRIQIWGGGEVVGQPKMCIPPGKILGTPLIAPFPKNYLQYGYW
jgi:hypothetical protein